MKGGIKMKFTQETWRRALRTLIQVAASYVAANILVVDFTAEKEVLTSALIGLVVSALATGLAAVMNLEKVETETGTDEEVMEEETE
jgi:hypothetical protein